MQRKLQSVKYDPPHFDHPEQMFGSRSYSQHGDDFIIANVFHRLGIRRPSYIDVGAHHPYYCSNTAMFYGRGARGINVEANPHLLAAFMQHRLLDQNLNYGVSDRPGKLPFYLVDDTGITSSFIQPKIPHKVIEVELVTLSWIIDKYSAGVWPDFLNVDAEGMDLTILSTLPAKIGPKVICTEVIGADQSIERMAKFLMASKDYYAHAWAGSNLIFVRESFREAVQP